MKILQRAQLVAEAENDPKAQAAHLTICQNDPVYWMNTFCWTFDPRKDEPHQPFNLYPFQEWAVYEWIKHIEQGQDFLIEKARDMGVTWLILLTFQWGWLFRDGWNFHIGSRKQDTVDTLGDLSTHFPKLRYNLQWLPTWMKPESFDPKRHDTYMKLINPVNGNTITGESSNPEFARGGRYKAVAFDEFAFWQHDEAAWVSASQSTPCRIAVSTPHGKANKFATLALDPINDRKEPPRLLIS